MIHLDGRTLEGGGQLVRNAIALSALTGKSITISHIRGNRHGKTGLKGSHAAAIKFLVEICQGEIVGGEIGSQTLTFYPRGQPQDDEEENQTQPLLNLTLANGELPKIKSRYTINQSTAGSIFLIFQALYPYLVYAGSLSNNLDAAIELNVTGGTNVTCAPSFDYIEQVLVPNLRKIGLPELSIKLRKRGWSTGPVDLGAVTFQIHPLGSNSPTDMQDESIGGFPALNLSQYRRGPVTKIDITILAPDKDLRDKQAQGNRKDRRKAGNELDDAFPKISIREYLEEQTERRLRRAMERLPSDIITQRSTSNDAEDDEIMPIEVRTSEGTLHHTHLYILLVAHMSSGFTIGADALFDGFKDRGSKRGSGKHGGAGRHRGDRDGNSIISTLDELADSCVNSLMEELHGSSDSSAKHQSYVDVHMRDQLVIFDALGSLERQAAGHAANISSEEDERYWSLHTRTARWVCEQILGPDVWDKRHTSLHDSKQQHVVGKPFIN
ncbi:RNA 3'-terminal phosphate cyclase/enolpyruvate transferase [Talaromyces proteolyticus]|uniref:RNA 3'-terminal phosphate cyclase/enolpyruvate transferase n=1 Tax=Talaromyces proteolyticus TaxID=1131652 RepID=A0AAD4KY62_9EURO|nr:RNA 3'-terminal phosphate cyclase/enolpyruvate transferase [Talaromyces proteolyticus]KAH8702430.1 RNA 3'-terminal phosphate cyclase/enolpyruvate transferase [Talaromyces proteolyticus]